MAQEWHDFKDSSRFWVDTPPKINMEPGTWKWWFPIGISFSKGPFSGSMFVLGGVPEILCLLSLRAANPYCTRILLST